MGSPTVAFPKSLPVDQFAALVQPVLSKTPSTALEAPEYAEIQKQQRQQFLEFDDWLKQRTTTNEQYRRLTIGDVRRLVDQSHPESNELLRQWKEQMETYAALMVRSPEVQESMARHNRTHAQVLSVVSVLHKIPCSDLKTNPLWRCIPAVQTIPLHLPRLGILNEAQLQKEAVQHYYLQLPTRFRDEIAHLLQLQTQITMLSDQHTSSTRLCIYQFKHLSAAKEIPKLSQFHWDVPSLKDHETWSYETERMTPIFHRLVEIHEHLSLHGIHTSGWEEERNILLSEIESKTHGRLFWENEQRRCLKEWVFAIHTCISSRWDYICDLRKKGNLKRLVLCLEEVSKFVQYQRTRTTVLALGGTEHSTLPSSLPAIDQALNSAAREYQTLCVRDASDPTRFLEIAGSTSVETAWKAALRSTVRTYQWAHLLTMYVAVANHLPKQFKKHPPVEDVLRTANQIAEIGYKEANLFAAELIEQNTVEESKDEERWRSSYGAVAVAWIQYFRQTVLVLRTERLEEYYNIRRRLDRLVYRSSAMVSSASRLTMTEWMRRHAKLLEYLKSMDTRHVPLIVGRYSASHIIQHLTEMTNGPQQPSYSNWLFFICLLHGVLLFGAGAASS